MAAQQPPGGEKGAAKGTEPEIGPVITEKAMRPHNGMGAVVYHDRVGIGCVEVRIRTEPHHNEELTRSVLGGEPVAFVGARICRVDETHRVGSLMDRVLVECAQRRMFSLVPRHRYSLDAGQV